MADWLPTLIDIDAILWGVFVVGILIGAILIGLWALVQKPLLGIIILAASFIGAAIYFGVIG